MADGAGLQVFRRVQSDVRERVHQPSSVVKRSAVGTDALDTLCGGGLYEGSVTLIIGNSGAGKSILGYQLVVEGVEKLRKRALLISSDEHGEQILRNADSIGLSFAITSTAAWCDCFTSRHSKLKSMRCSRTSAARSSSIRSSAWFSTG
jgi:KaiC/GvpD/RAD55 family RecA-like ATPase